MPTIVGGEITIPSGTTELYDRITRHIRSELAKKMISVMIAVPILIPRRSDCVRMVRALYRSYAIYTRENPLYFKAACRVPFSVLQNRAGCAILIKDFSRAEGDA